MKYTIYKNDVGQLMAMEGHCEFDGVVAQAIDYDAVKNTLLRAGETQPNTPHEHYWFNLGHQSNKIAEENNVIRAENARLKEALREIIDEGHSDLCLSMKRYRPEYVCTYEIAHEALRGDITPDKGES
jgi:hypothetical protein